MTTLKEKPAVEIKVITKLDHVAFSKLATKIEALTGNDISGIRSFFEKKTESLSEPTKAAVTEFLDALDELINP